MQSKCRAVTPLPTWEELKEQPPQEEARRLGLQGRLRHPGSSDRSTNCTCRSGCRSRAARPTRRIAKSNRSVKGHAFMILTRPYTLSLSACGYMATCEFPQPLGSRQFRNRLRRTPTELVRRDGSLIGVECDPDGGNAIFVAADLVIPIQDPRREVQCRQGSPDRVASSWLGR